MNDRNKVLAKAHITPVASPPGVVPSVSYNTHTGYTPKSVYTTPGYTISMVSTPLLYTHPGCHN